MCVRVRVRNAVNVRVGVLVFAFFSQDFIADDVIEVRFVCVCVSARVCVCVCVCARARVRARVCVRACVYGSVSARVRVWVSLFLSRFHRR